MFEQIFANLPHEENLKNKEETNFSNFCKSALEK